MDLRQYPDGHGARGSRYIGDTLVEFGVAKTLHAHLTLPEVNAGATLLKALLGVRWQLLDWRMVAHGGDAGGATSLNVSGIRDGLPVHLAVTAIAALVRSAMVRAGRRRRHSRDDVLPRPRSHRLLGDGSETYTCRGGQNVDRLGLSVRSSPTTSTGSALGAGSLGSFERTVDVAHTDA